MNRKTERSLFRVGGMYCITCKPIVEKQLKDEGIKRIDIEYMTDSVVVEFDSSIITKEEIKEKLEKVWLQVGWDSGSMKSQ